MARTRNWPLSDHCSRLMMTKTHIAAAPGSVDFVDGDNGIGSDDCAAAAVEKEKTKETKKPMNHYSLPSYIQTNKNVQ